MKFILTILCTLVLTMGATSLLAQNADKPWSIGLSTGKATYGGDMGIGFFDFDQAFHGFGGLKVARYLNPSFDVALDGTYGRHGYWVDNTTNFLSDNLHANLTANYKFNNGYILNEDALIAPYLFAGLGIANASGVDDRAQNGLDFAIPLGLGANLNITDWLSTFYQGTFGLTFGDGIEFQEADGNDNFMHHAMGLKVNFGSKKDSDGDGVSDSKDTCPDVPGLADLNGCPDSDGDGIADKNDSCPNVAGVEAFHGCPDTDGDGIADKDDACPKKKGSAQFKGCPDTDGDGIADNMDACPSMKGPASAKGCPDTDGDGIVDNKDNCPDVAGVQRFGGCPEIDKSTLSIMAEALQGVHFETAKSVIKTQSLPILDKVVGVMKKYPNYKLSIDGYTDSDGAEASNLTLSQNRANAVKTYLTSKGVAASRMTAKGHGETNPVAPNTTSAGKAKNRRVEFTVRY